MNTKVKGIVIAVIASGILIGALAVLVEQSVLPCFLPACGPAPPQGQKLALYSYHLNSPTNVTIKMSNLGTVQITLISYLVNDSFNHQYANFNWPGPTIDPGMIVAANILIDGTAFTFQIGHTYIVEVNATGNGKWPLYFTA